MEKNDALDPVYASDRNAGSTSPETAEASTNIVGRPGQEAGFHERTERVSEERESFSAQEALDDGGSFDGLGVPVADDSTA